MVFKFYLTHVSRRKSAILNSRLLEYSSLKDTLALKFHPGKVSGVRNPKMASKTSHDQSFLSYSQIRKFFA